MHRWLFIIGSVFGFIGVAAGAFGAHTLRNIISPELLQVFETGVRYQMYHAFALFITAWAISRYADVYFRFAAVMFIIGIVLFSGSLYALALTDIRGFGAVTPFGGVSFLAGWVLMILGFVSVKKNARKKERDEESGI